MTKDSEQLDNVAADPRYAEIRGKLSKQLNSQLKATGDPRVLDGGRQFDLYPYPGGVPKYPKQGGK